MCSNASITEILEINDKNLVIIHNYKFAMDAAA